MVHPLIARGAILGLLASMLLSVADHRLARAADGTVVAELTAAFKPGNRGPIEGLRLALLHCDNAQRLAPNDVRVTYARGLVLMQYHKNAEAARQFENALGGGQALLPVRRARIYVAVLLKDYRTADTEMRALANRLSGDDHVGAAEQPYRDSARFLGGVVEYLAMQVGPLVKAEDVAALDRHVKSKLKGERAADYVAGRADVAKRAAGLGSDLKSAKADALATETAKKAAKQAQVDEAAAPYLVEAARIDALEQAFKVEQAPARKIHEPIAHKAEAAMAPLLAVVNPIRSRINGKEREIAGKQKDIEKLQQDRADAAKNVPKIAELEKQILDLQREIGRLSNQAAVPEAAISQIIAANAPSLQYMAGYESQLQALAAAKDPIERALHKLKTFQRVINQTVADEFDPKSSALNLKSKAISSFVDLDLAVERERVLKTYRRK